MKAYNLKTEAYILIAIGFVIWLLETWYYGWNDYPSCFSEWIWDFISSVIFLTGMWIWAADYIADVVVKKLKGLIR
jgi:hypothetical protein